MRRYTLSDITPWITEAALDHPQRLAAHLVERLGVSRTTANRLLRALETHQWLRREGTARRPTHSPGPLRQAVRSYALEGLQEDRAWARDFAPRFDLPVPTARLVQHAFTELVNNAIDHSGGSQVVVSMRQTPTQVQLLVSDNGRGLFDVVGERFAIPDPGLAMLELAKGRLTTAPQCHTGRGLYFTARSADVIDLHANARAFQQRQWQPDCWHPVRSACRAGTSVYVAFRLDVERLLDEVLRRGSVDGRGFGLERTVVPLRLAADAAGVLESRALARRIAARLETFRRVEVDFAGITGVGHAFADELFRVFGSRHPGLRLEAVNASEPIAALLESVREVPLTAAA